MAQVAVEQHLPVQYCCCCCSPWLPNWVSWLTLPVSGGRHHHSLPVIPLRGLVSRVWGPFTRGLQLVVVVAVQGRQCSSAHQCHASSASHSIQASFIRSNYYLSLSLSLSLSLILLLYLILSLILSSWLVDCPVYYTGSTKVYCPTTCTVQSSPWSLISLTVKWPSPLPSPASVRQFSTFHVCFYRHYEM